MNKRALSIRTPDMPSLPRTVFALVVISLFGLAALSQATGGFRTLSSESMRRIAIIERSANVPNTRLALATGGNSLFQQTLAADGRVAIVAFVYTGCDSFCSMLNGRFRHLQDAIRQHGAERDVRLISISFDPADSPAQLRRYARSLHADNSIWQFAGVPDTVQRRFLLASFGVVVVPTSRKQFQHNAAFHIVTPEGRLVRIIDASDPDAALAVAMAFAKYGTSTAAL